MSTDREEQEERRATVLNDARVRAQQEGTTFSQFARSEAAEDRGRFTAHEKSTVIGSTPVPNYPQGPAFIAHDLAAQIPIGAQGPIVIVRFEFKAKYFT